MHIRLKTFLWLISPPLLLVCAAYIQWGTAGLPALAPIPELAPATTAEPYGFPAWLRVTHYVNFMFLILLIRSGLQILMDHPRLYSNVHCTPGTEWLRLTPIEVPRDRVWTAKRRLPPPLSHGSACPATGTPSAWPGAALPSASCSGWATAWCS